MDVIDARAFLTKGLPGFPAASLYVSPTIGDPAVDALPAFLDRLGFPLTVVEDGDTLVLQPAGRGWRCGLSASGRLVVTGRGHVLVEVEKLRAVPGWKTAALAEGRVLVVVGPPVPFIAGAGNFGELLTWIGTRRTCSAVVPAVEI